MMKVEFKKKGQVVASSEQSPLTTPPEQPAPQQTKKEDSSQAKQRNWKYAQDHSTAESADPVSTNIIHLVKQNGLPLLNAASMLTGRIRYVMINGIRKSEDQTLQFEIESFKYLDSILFNDLTYLIASIMQFGSRNNIPLSNVVRMVTDSASMVDYYIPKNDMETIRGIITEIYHAF